MTNNLISHSDFYAYFGDAVDQLPHADSGKTTEFYALSNKIAEQTHQSTLPLFFLKQTHGDRVSVLTDRITTHCLFQQTGDAIITQEKNIGIGVVTADCLPIFLFDPEHKAIGVIHAVWKGLSQKIITKTLQAMTESFASQPEKILAYIGPAAKACCYEVQPDFLKNFSGECVEHAASYRDGKIFFETLTAAIEELLENHIAGEYINTHHHTCTICTPRYCSFRRDKKNAGRQASIIFLR